MVDFRTFGCYTISERNGYVIAEADTREALIKSQELTARDFASSESLKN